LDLRRPTSSDKKVVEVISNKLRVDKKDGHQRLISANDGKNERRKQKAAENNVKAVTPPIIKVTYFH